MSVMLCVALLMCLFVLCVACLTVFVNCLKQFAMCVGVVAILLLNVMDVFSVCGILVHIHPYHPSDILQLLSIFLLHIKCIKIHASLFPQVHNHTYNHCTSMSSFHSLLQANILPLPSFVLLNQNFHFLDFLPFCVTALRALHVVKWI